MEMKVFFGVK